MSQQYFYCPLYFSGGGCSDNTNSPEQIEEDSGLEQENPTPENPGDDKENSGNNETEKYILDCKPSISLTYSTKTSKYYPTVKYVNSYSFDNYKLYRAESENGNYEELATINNYPYSYTDSTAETGKTYWYKFTAVKNSDNQTYTSEAIRWDHFSFKFYEEKDLTFEKGFSSIKLSWEADPEADGYTVYLNKYANFKDEYILQKKETTDTTCTFKNVTPNSFFYVAVLPKKGQIEAEKLTGSFTYTSIDFKVEIENVIATDKTVIYSIKTNIEEDNELIESIKYELRGSTLNDYSSPFYGNSKKLTSVESNSNTCDIELDYYEKTKELAYYKHQWLNAYVIVTYKDSEGKSTSKETYDSSYFYNKLPAPTDVIATPGRNNISVSFTPACGSTAKYPLSSSLETVKYIACVYDAEGNLVKESSASATSPIKISKLQNETEYTVKVTPVLGIYGTGQNTSDEYRNYADGGTVTTGKPMDLPTFKSISLEDEYVIAEINPIGSEDEIIIYGFEYQTLMTEYPSSIKLGKGITVCTKENNFYLSHGNSYFVRIYAYIDGNINDIFYSDYVTLKAPSITPKGCDTALRFAPDGDVIDIVDPETWADGKTPRSVKGKYNIGFINLCGEGSTLSATPVQTTESTNKYIVRFGLTEDMLKSENPIKILVVDATSTIGNNTGLIKGCSIINIANSFSTPSNVSLTKVGVLDDDGSYSSITTDGPDKAGFEVKYNHIYNDSVFLQVEVSTTGTTGGLGFSYYY